MRYVLLSLVFGICFVASGQGIPSTGGGGGEADSTKDFSFVPIPYMNYDRSLGFSIGALPLAMYSLSKKDTLSPNSISGALAMYTTNDSWFLFAFNKWYFNQDNYRVLFAAGRLDVNFQFYAAPPIGGFVDYNTGAWFAKAEIQRRIYKKLYGGVGYTYAKFDTSFGESDTLKTTDVLHGLGLVLSYDGRDNVYYPRKGFLTDINYTSFPEALGNSFISKKIEIDYNQFWPIKDNHVFGARMYVGLGIGDLSFNQQFIVGQTDIRGYSQGEYRGDQIVAVQGEYRHNFENKLGLVGFFGLASVFNSINEDHNGLVLPGVGVGIRYIVIPKNHMNVGIDVAAGKGDWGLYFKIGEAF